MAESTKVDRNALAKVFKDPKTLRAVEAALNSVQDGSSALALATQAIAETAALRAPTYLVASADPTLNNERVLGGASGVSIDYSTPGLATINVNVSGALGYTPTSVVGLTGVQSVAAFKIGLALDLVENKSSATIRSEITSGNVTGALGFTPLAPANNLSELTNYATARSNLGLIIGTNVQAYNANLTTYAGIAPSANVQTFLGAANYAAMRTQLGLVIGTNVQAQNAFLSTLAGLAAASQTVAQSSQFSWVSFTAVAAGSTVYVGSSGQSTVESAAYFIAPCNGTISDFYASATAAPGVGQTYTFTIRKNGVDTAFTAQTAGAATVATNTPAVLTFARGDLVSVKLVTSAGAAVQFHRGFVLFTPT